MFFALALAIDEDVIEVYYYKNIEFLCQDLVDIALKRGWCVGQSKRHHLLLKMAIAGPEGYFPFIAFSDPYLMIDIDQIKLGEILSPT